MKLLYIFTIFLQLAYLLYAKSNSLSGDRVLVVLDNIDDKEQYSIFLKNLIDRGYDVSYISAKDEKFQIIKYEESLYDHLILLAPETKYYENDVNAKQLIQFINNGGNMIVTANENTGNTVQDLLYEFGMVVDEPKFTMIDNFRHNSTTPNIIAIEDMAMPIGMDKLSAPVLYYGTSAKSSGKNPYNKPVLVGGPASYSWDYSTVVQNPMVTGSDAILVSALQALNNSRIIITGSVKMFSDEYVKSAVEINNKKYEISGNLDFINNISKWAFQEKKVLKIISSDHRRIKEDKKPEYYSINDDIHYEITISEYNEGIWVPFNASDIQLELIMLDPYIRTTLKQQPITDPTSSTFSKDLRVPDHCGVFTFKVDYRRYGYSWLLESDVIPIHPYHYNEFPRFLKQGIPYYIGAFSMIGGFFLISILALYHEDTTPKKEKSKKE